MDLPILISSDDDVPIYLQLRYQLTYLITTRQLPEGGRLPSVRALATDLGINAGTVSLAYRELQADGLIASQKGHGTFVQALDTVDPESQAARQNRLTELLEEAAAHASNLGFSPATIQHRFGVVLNLPDRGMRIAFVGTTDAITRRYAAAIERYLAERNAEVVPVTFEALRANTPEVRRALRGVYFIVTFALIETEVQRVLRRRRAPVEVLGITTEATPDTMRRIQGLDPDARVLFVSPPQFLHGFLNFLRTRSRVPEASIHALLDVQESEIRAAMPGADVIVYTSGVVDLLDRLGVPGEKRLELVYQATGNALEKLGKAMAHDPLGGRPAPRRAVVASAN